MGSVPGVIIVKRTDTTSGWYTFHRSLGATKGVQLNATDSSATEFWWNSTAPTDSSFQLNAVANISGGTYVAYLFAHNDDDGEFGESGDQDMIKCGSWTDGNNVNVDLGFEPQWVLYKRSDGTGNWFIADNMRGITSQLSNGVRYLLANSSAAEADTTAMNLFPTGFGYSSTISGVGHEFIYIAIRRGPMKTPESGSEVFATATRGDAGDSKSPGLRSGFPVDWLIWRADKNSSGDNTSYQRLTASNLYTHSTCYQCCTRAVHG